MPQTTVRTPAGEVTVSHPEGATDEEILGFAQQQYQAQISAEEEAVVPPPSYVERVMQPTTEFKPEFKRRLATLATQIPEVPGSGQIGVSDVAGTAISQAARTGGAMAVEALTPLGTAISQVARTGGAMAVEAFTPLIPQTIKDAFDKAITATGQKLSEFYQNPNVQEMMLSISSGYDSYKNWEKNNWALANQIKENLGTGIDIMGLFSPRADLVDIDFKLPGEMKARKAGVASDLARRKEALTRMLEPETLTAQDKAPPVGLLQTRTWLANDFDESVIDTVQTIPGIQPYGSITKNFSIMQDHVDNQSVKLSQYIKAQNKPVDMEALNLEFSETMGDFMNSDVYQLATDQAQRQFLKYMDLAQKIIAEEGKDLKGLLAARKRFDTAVQAAGQTLEADVSTYQGLAAKMVRGVMNDYIKSNTKGNEVHHLLDQQFRTLTAMDRLVNKRNREGINVPARLLDSIKQNTGITLSATALSVVATYSLAAGSPVAATAIGGAALGSIFAKQIRRHGKAVVLKSYAELLSATNKAIKKINDPLELERMELDRLVLIDLIDEIRNYEETEEDE
jgi:hypothetical protein